MIKTLVLIGLVFVAGVSSAGAVEPRDQQLRAIGAYQKGDYAAATEVWSQLAASGWAGADAWFNAGTAALAAGRRGEAVLYLRRALLVRPDDADALFNLAEAQKGNVDKVVGAREEPPLVERIGERTPAGPVSYAFVASWMIGLGALLMARYLSRGRAVLRWAGALSLVVACVAGTALAACAWHRHAARYAVVTAASTALREGPSRDFKTVFELHEGLELRVVDREGAFLRVRLPNGVEGWVASGDVPEV